MPETELERFLKTPTGALRSVLVNADRTRKMCSYGVPGVLLRNQLDLLQRRVTAAIEVLNANPGCSVGSKALPPDSPELEPSVTLDVLRTEMEQRFPWLLNDDSANGGDVVEEVQNWYNDLDPGLRPG